YTTLFRSGPHPDQPAQAGRDGLQDAEGLALRLRDLPELLGGDPRVDGLRHRQLVAARLGLRAVYRRERRPSRLSESSLVPRKVQRLSAEAKSADPLRDLSVERRVRAWAHRRRMGCARRRLESRLRVPMPLPLDPTRQTAFVGAPQ